MSRSCLPARKLLELGRCGCPSWVQLYQIGLVLYLPCKHSRCSDRGRLGASLAVLTVTLVCSGRETRDFVYAVYGTIVTVKNV